MTSLADVGPGTLRATIAAAANGDTIQFDPTQIPANGTVRLNPANGAIAINKDLKIDGQALNITVDGASQTQIFDIGNFANVEIDNLSFQNGFSQGSGGAIYDGGGSLTLSSDTFKNNTASTSGGAIFAGGLSGPLIVKNNCSFIQNIAQNGSGGAIYASSTSLANDVELSNTTFAQNRATGTGGAVYAVPDITTDATQLKITACSFQGNQTNGSSGGDGGAVYTQDQLNVSGGTFSSNGSEFYGGGIAYEPPTNQPSSLTLSNITFASNTAVQGGGVYIVVNTSQGAVTETISGCLFNHNLANTSSPGALNEGGGLAVSQTTASSGSASLKVFNSTFYNNEAVGVGVEGVGGGIALYASTGSGSSNRMQLISLTVYGNTGFAGGGGLFVNANSTFPAGDSVELLNSIIAGNTISSPDDQQFGPDISGVIYSRAHNLIGIGDAASGVSVINGWQPSDIVGTAAAPQAAGLDPNGLQNNGGPTMTIKLLNTSAGFHKGDSNLLNNNDGTQLDERGFARGNPPSIGAYDPG